MKYLSDYTEPKVTKLIEEVGAFFAFSQKQYSEQAKPNTKYVSVMGTIVPEDKARYFYEAMEAIHEASIQEDIEENGIKAIIHRELADHECQLSGDSSIVEDALEPYGITAEQVAAEWAEFYQHCVDNDYF